MNGWPEGQPVAASRPARKESSFVRDLDSFGSFRNTHLLSAAFRRKEGPPLPAAPINRLTKCGFVTGGVWHGSAFEKAFRVEDQQHQSFPLVAERERLSWPNFSKATQRYFRD